MEIKSEHILSPFERTEPIVARYMIELTEPKEGDTLLDIGSGTGEIVLEAAKPEYKLKKVFGIEYEKERVKESRCKVKELGLEDKIEIIQIDALKYDFSKINPNIITMYLTESGVNKLKAKLESELKPGTRVVSSVNEVEGWEPSRAVRLKYGKFKRRDIFIYKIGEAEKKGFLYSLRKKFNK